MSYKFVTFYKLPYSHRSVGGHIDQRDGFGDTPAAKRYYRQCRELSLDTDPDQPIWADGEYIGRTPVTIKVLPGALSVVVP